MTTFGGLVYFVNDPKLADTEFVGIYRGQLFGAGNSWVFLEFPEMFDYLVVRFVWKTGKFFDGRFRKNDAVDPYFFCRTLRQIVVERNRRFVFAIFDDGGVSEDFGKYFVPHQLSNEQLPLRSLHRLKRRPRNLRYRLWLGHNFGIKA